MCTCMGGWMGVRARVCVHVHVHVQCAWGGCLRVRVSQLFKSDCIEKRQWREGRDDEHEQEGGGQQVARSDGACGALKAPSG
jgi:hypothetical protein